MCLKFCNRCLCTSGIETLQVDYSESVHQLNKVVKSVYTVKTWSPYLKNNKVSKVPSESSSLQINEGSHTPARVSAPSCIIPSAEDVAVRPYLVPLLPTFHGMENENPYTHIRDFEEVCITFKEGMMDMDLLKLKAFPLTLKDKAKIWLNSLRPRTIRNWAELQVEFLKKFFSAHKTNNLKRQIYTFAALDNERFYQCWERFMETISACPHHGFDTWMLVNHFHGGMSPAMKQLLETMCGGDFLSKHPDEAMDFLNYVAETSKGLG